MENAEKPPVAPRGFLPLDDVRRVLTLAVPAMLALLTQTAVNIVDTWFFGQMPEPDRTNAQSMHSDAIILLWLVGGFFSAISVGTQALVARRAGAGDDPAAGGVITNSMLLAFGASTVAAVAGWLAIPSIYALMSHNPDYVRLASAYTQWRFAGVVSMVMTSSCKSFFDGTGRTYVHFLASVVMNIANLIGCWLLIFGNAGFPRLGVGGAGIAAAASSWVGLFVMLGFLFRKGNRARYRPMHASSLSRRMVWEVARLSIPSGIATSAVMTGFFLFRRIVTRLDAQHIATTGLEAYGAATTIIIQVLSITFFSCLAFGVATATLVSQRLGARDPEGAERLAWSSVKIGVLAFGTLGLLEAIYPEACIAIFNRSPEVISAGASSMRLMGACGPFFAIAMILTQALFGAGNTRYVMVVELALHFGVLVPAAWLFGVVLDLGLLGVWSSAALYGILLAGAMAWKFRRGDWKTIRI